MSRIGAGVGSAAFVLGLSIVGPQAMGVAAAETGDSDSSAVSHATAGSQRSSAGSARPRHNASSALSAAGVRPASGATSAGSRHAAAAAATTSGAADESADAVQVTSSTHGRSARSIVTSAATANSAEATTGQSASVDNSAVVVTQSHSATAAVTASSWGSLFSPQAANVAVNGWLDSVQGFLTGLGKNPITDLLQGALLLVRRNLFDQTPTAKSYEYALRSDGGLVGAFNVVDPEGATVTYKLTGEPTNGVATVNSDGTWTYAPGPDFVYDSFKVTVDDGGFNIFDPTAGRREVTVRVGTDPNAPVQGIGTISKYIRNDTGLELINAYYGPRYQGTYNGIVSGPPDNFVLQPGDYAVYETEWNIFSGDAYDVVMEWRATSNSQYLWTVDYQYEGTGTANFMSCSLSSQPCNVGRDAPDAYLLPPVTV